MSTRNGWNSWASSVPQLICTSTQAPRHDPAATATRLAQAGLADQYMVYEAASGVWHFAAGSAVRLTAHRNAVTARAAGRTWTSPTGRQPLTEFAAALRALSAAHDPNAADGAGTHFYGWAAFELAHLLHADPAAGGDGPLLHALIPSVEVTLTRGRSVIRAVDEAWLHKVSDLLAEPTARHLTPGGTTPEMSERIIAAGTDAYGSAVSRTVEDIRAGLLEKAVVSRKVPLPAVPPVNFPATYLTGRRANTPPAPTFWTSADTGRPDSARRPSWRSARTAESVPSPSQAHAHAERTLRRTSASARSCSATSRRYTNTPCPYAWPGTRWPRYVGRGPLRSRSSWRSGRAVRYSTWLRG